MNFYKPFVKLLGPLFTRWWCFWSNVRFKKAIRTDKTLLREEDKVSTIKDIRKLAVTLYQKFEWTADGIDELWDAVTPPPQNYSNYIAAEELKDDCDGFHSVMHYCLSMSGIECYLLSVNAWGLGHCVLLFKYRNKWYVNDYMGVYGPHDTAAQAIQEYNKTFVEDYQPKSEVWYNALVAYDYDLGKFKVEKSIKIKE